MCRLLRGEEKLGAGIPEPPTALVAPLPAGILSQAPCQKQHLAVAGGGACQEMGVVPSAELPGRSLLQFDFLSPLPLHLVTTW